MYKLALEQIRQEREQGNVGFYKTIKDLVANCDRRKTVHASDGKGVNVVQHQQFTFKDGVAIVAGGLIRFDMRYED